MKSLRQRYPKEYTAWSSMKTRCLNSNSAAYVRYGGRGIKVCDRWLHSFENFFKDMGPSPKNKSLDRRNNDKSYNRQNCRWATQKQQMVNTRKNNFKTREKQLKNLFQAKKYYLKNKYQAEVQRIVKIIKLLKAAQRLSSNKGK